MDFSLSLTYTLDGVSKKITESVHDLEIVQVRSNDRLTVKINAHKPLQINEAVLTAEYPFAANDRFFANGYQSWTDTREFTKNEKMPDIGLLGKTPTGKKMGLHFVGDYTFASYSRRRGVFHSNSYTYIRHGAQVELIGSMTDRTGWTVFEANMHKNKLKIYKDVEGVTMDGEYVLFDLYFANGSYDEVFDRYFDVLGVKPMTDKKIKGYTSWYNYYQNISEEVIFRDLESLASRTSSIDTFQIDDGYQMTVGDWLNVNPEKFPNGMKVTADAIHAKGLQAGLWLAPFGMQHNCALLEEHPDWIVRDEKGKGFYVGGNWGGFYALDIYNEEVREYIRHFFDVVLNEWGFDLVKLDFLYAASVLPRNGKSRGQIMYEAIEFIRECVGDKKILGCGVQMMPCFGKVEYMRIGADMTHQWKDVINFTHREDTSTVNALYNSIFRRHLNGRAFLCDPDVFLLRDYNINFTFEERKRLAKIIKIFGSVLFTSGDVNRYNDEQMAVLEDTLSKDEAVLDDVTLEKNICTIVYTERGQKNTLRFNIKNGKLA